MWHFFRDISIRAYQTSFWVRSVTFLASVAYKLIELGVNNRFLFNHQFAEICFGLYLGAKLQMTIQNVISSKEVKIWFLMAIHSRLKKTLVDYRQGPSSQWMCADCEKERIKYKVKTKERYCRFFCTSIGEKGALFQTFSFSWKWAIYLPMAFC